MNFLWKVMISCQKQQISQEWQDDSVKHKNWSCSYVWMMRENKSWQESWVRDKNDKVKHVVDKRVLVNMLETCRIVCEINKFEEVQEVLLLWKVNKFLLWLCCMLCNFTRNNLLGLWIEKSFKTKNWEWILSQENFLWGWWKEFPVSCGKVKGMEKLLWTQIESSLWNKWIGKQTCGKFFHKKCVLELDEWTIITRNTCRDCWGRTETHWFLVELWDFLWFIANTMKLNNSLCYSSL